jgi:hypothetical protein
MGERIAIGFEAAVQAVEAERRALEAHALKFTDWPACTRLLLNLNGTAFAD